jgi:putative toxin-antitoxin system antitoxin component (TIGR02293 family)
LAAEHKAQTTQTGFEQITQVLRGMNELVHEAQTSAKDRAQMEKRLLERIKQALAISEAVGKEGEWLLPALTTISPLRTAYLTKISELLLMRHSETLLDIHKQLRDGLEVRSVTHLLGSLSAIPRDEALSALGVSWRTIERRSKTARKKPLSQEQSGRVFKFAEVLAKATDVFGSQEEAEAWLSRPAMGLNRQRPIDLLATPAGLELVERFLSRLDYGVYT